MFRWPPWKKKGKTRTVPRKGEEDKSTNPPAGTRVITDSQLVPGISSAATQLPNETDHKMSPENEGQLNATASTVQNRPKLKRQDNSEEPDLTGEELLKKMEALLEARMGKLQENLESSLKDLGLKVSRIEEKMQMMDKEPHVSTKGFEAITNSGGYSGGNLHTLREEEENGGSSGVPEETTEPSSHSSPETEKERQRACTCSKVDMWSWHREKMKRYRETQFESFPEISRYQLPPRPCDQKVILWFTAKVAHWKFLARWLGLEESDISRIIEEYPTSLREQCYQMIRRWREMYPQYFNYRILGDALLKENQGQLYAEFVEEVMSVESANVAEALAATSKNTT